MSLHLRMFSLTLLLMIGTYVRSETQNQLLVFRDLPSPKAHQPVGLVIRNNFQGSVNFVESDEFQIVLNITASNADDLAKVQYNYTNYEGSVLLQVYEKEILAETSPIRYMVLLIGGGTLLAFLCMIIFACWWNVYCRPFVKETLLFNPDSSEAPLLDDKGSGHSQNGGQRLRKKKRRRVSHPPGSEDLASSEEDTLDRGLVNAIGPGNQPSPQKHTTPTAPHYVSNTLGRPAPQTIIESDLVATVRQTPSKSFDHPDGTQTLPHPHAMHDASGKPVVSYIKIQPDGQDAKGHSCMKKPPGQYIPLSQSEGSGASDGEKSAQRESPYDYHTMPDVVRSRNRPTPPERTSQPADRIYRTNSGRYVRLSNNEVDSSDNEYLSNTMPASVVGAQTMTPQVIPPTTMSPQSQKPVGVVQLLGETPGKSSPKFSHNTDRLPTTFCQPINLHKPERHGVDLDLDSVGSSRSGGSSSMTSGIKTQSGSVTDSDRRTMSDSDSASVSSVPAKPPGILKDTGYNHKQFIHPHAQNNRLVDEAYGTMSSNSGHSNGTGTMRSHSSTASNGSGSSGSVVTIIAASDNNGTEMSGTFNRRRPRKGYESSGSESGTLERPSGGGGGGGGTSTFTGGPAKFVHMSIITTLCCLCLMTGVYCQLKDTTVHITIYLPQGHVRNGSEVYFNERKRGILDTSQMRYPLQILRYDAEEANIMDPNSQACSEHTCSGACDINTGKCLCSQGQTLSGRSKCEDVDECLTQPTVCDRAARCYNLPNTYQCICNKGYYGDGRKCYNCDQPCTNNTYAAMPCIGSNPKICKACSTECPKEHYISAPCTHLINTACTSCTPRCQRDKYEFTPCVGKHNRKCKDTTILMQPDMSKNLIFENRKSVKDCTSYILSQEEGAKQITHELSISRGSGFSVQINLRRSNLAAVYQAVDHSASNDNDGFYGDITITERYCPQPVPEKYQLSMIMHMGVTSQAEYHHCNKKKRSNSSCKGQTGYYLHPRQPCESYSLFGRLPPLNTHGWSIVCNKPGVLSEAFDVSSDLTELTTMFVDKTVRCAEQRTNCDTCQAMCATTIKERQGSHRCNVTAENSDNGESPRLSHCLGCCAQQDCSEHCRVYHDQQCEPIRCVTGNLAEFVLTPVFAHRGTAFGCHVAPKPDYTIYDIDYYVYRTPNNAQGGNNRYTGPDAAAKIAINGKILHAVKTYEGKHPSKASEVHDFLKVVYGSEMSRDVTFIEGDSGSQTFNAGHYTDSGRTLADVPITEDNLSVRPKTPFAVNSHMWGSEDCDSASLEDLLLAADQYGSTDPYVPNPQLIVKPEQRGEYRVFNRSAVPFMYFQIPENVSILAPLYGDTTVKEDVTLKGELHRRRNVWQLNIKGELMECPGFMSVKVYDPLYMDQSLYFYDIGVQCPKTFSLNFSIPTEGDDDYDKRFRVDITDSHRTIHMTVFRPAPNVTEGTYDKKYESSLSYENKGENRMSIFTPLVAVLCVVVCFLAILLIIGFVTESAKPHRGTENKVHSQHLLFVVCYVTFRAAYSLAVTFTVLLLLIRFVNRDSVNTMMEFHRFVDTANNVQKLEVEKIQDHVMAELQRQNQLANQTKVLCEDKLQALQAVLEETKTFLRVEDGEERLISDMVLRYTRLLIMNLTNDINQFKSEFTSYSKTAMNQLMRNIVQTSSALQSNKWLAGAKVIYDVVASKRRGRNQETKPFMDWVGIQQEVESLSIDLSLRDFPMPNLTAYFSLDVPAMDHRQSELPNIDDIYLPRNQWYYQYENNKGSSDLNPGNKRGNKPRQGTFSNKHIMSYSSLLAVLIVVDVIWFIHRMAKTYSTAKMILYGCPYYIDCKKDGRGQRKAPSFSVTSRCFNFVKDLNLRIMKTEFIPKLVVAVTACCTLYLGLKVADHMMTVKTLASVGYFNSLIAPVQTSYSLAHTRIKTNAYRINKFEYPFYEELVNIRTKRYQLMLEMYRDLQRTNHMLHDSEYCAWVKMLDPKAKCNCTTAQHRKLSFDGCDLPPVSPQPYKHKDFTKQKEHLIASMMPYMNAGRQLVTDTTHLMLIFVALLVLVDLLGSITWIYLKRFNLLRLKPLFEIEQYPDSNQN